MNETKKSCGFAKSEHHLKFSHPSYGWKIMLLYDV